MLKKNIKSAMTLGEICMIFVVIGIIASLAIATIKPFERSAKMLYNRMYQALETATYNGLLDKAEFPQTATAFCNMLTEYINSPVNTCNTNVFSSNTAITFDENNASIIASNGARLYIVGNENKQLLTHTETIDGNNVSVKYYLVYVDINGSKGRGTTEWSEKNIADVVGFAITESGIVVPLGYPIIDTRYLTVRVGYPLEEDTEDITDVESENLSIPMSFYEARYRATGNKVLLSDEMTYNFQNDFPSGSLLYVPDSAYSTMTPNLEGEDNKCSSDITKSPCYIKFEDYE